MGNLPQQETLDQYVADGITTVYNYTYLILKATDIAAYVTPSGVVANPLVDIQPLNTAYTVQNIANLTGGTVTFQPGHIPPLGATVTLVRNMEISIDTEFAQAQNFNGQNLDNAFERVLLIMQQLNTDFQLRCLSYVINSYLPTLGTNFLPILTNIDQQIWISSGGHVVAAVLEENPDVSTLRSELANESSGTDGVGLIGYFDENNSLGQTLRTFLNNLPAYINNIINVNPVVDYFKTGDLKPSHDSAPPFIAGGFILWSNTTIGNAISGATHAAAFMQNLFQFYWDNYPDGVCPVSSGRGASATADFNASKTLALPLTDGCALVNCIANYTPGSKFGAATVSLTSSNNGPHNHPLSTVGTDPGSGAGTRQSLAVNQGQADPHDEVACLTISVDGDGAPFSIIPPSTGIFIQIKL